MLGFLHKSMARAVALPLRLPARRGIQRHHRAEGHHATFWTCGSNHAKERKTRFVSGVVLMGTIVPLDRDRGHTGAGHQPRPPRLSVTIEEVASVLRLRVSGARTPTRLYLYVDGDLVDTWVDIEASYDASPERLSSGRHAVTARAVDALGRWAGASTIVQR